MAATIVSWALTVSLIGVGIYYYRPDLFKSLTQQASQVAAHQTESSSRSANNKRSKSKKSVLAKVGDAITDSVPTSSNEQQGNKKRKIASEASGEKNKAHSTSTAQAGSSAADDTSLGDREFAQQLAKAQAGTDFQKADAQKSKNKTKATKQSQAKKLEPSGITTDTSSSAGRDADDDLTPVEETATEPTTHSTARAGDVSDMLEAPGAKPTTLRLTGISEENKNKKKKPASQPFEEVLTKKQRQNQAKKEELRQMKEESDRLHEAKKQEQLRKARMASGTSNQTKANNFTSTSNAWQSSQGTAAVKSAPSTQPAPLLDTFEPQPGQLGQANGAVHTEDLSNTNADSAASLKDQVGDQRASAMAASSREGPTATLSEEDQIKLIKEQAADDAWESVTSKKTKKKTRADYDDGSDAGPAAQHVTSAPAAKAQASSRANNDATKRSTLGNSSTNRFGAIPVETTSGMMDAEWEA